MLSISGGNSVDLSGYTPDNLGNHTASETLFMTGNNIVTPGAILNAGSIEYLGLLTVDTVGIGVETPEAKLHIKEAARNALTIQTSNNAISQGIAFRRSGTSYNWNIYRDASNSNALTIAGGSNSDLSSLTDHVVVETGGDVGIGTSNPTAPLHVVGNAVKTTGALWGIPSDRRLKTNIDDYERGLDDILAIRPVTFKYNNVIETGSDQVQVGVIAQELMEIAPEMVSLFSTGTSDEEYYKVNPSPMLYMLINAVQEIAVRNDLLESRSGSQQETIEQLTIDNGQLKKRLSNLEDQLAEIKVMISPSLEKN